MQCSDEFSVQRFLNESASLRVSTAPFMEGREYEHVIDVHITSYHIFRAYVWWVAVGHVNALVASKS